METLVVVLVVWVLLSIPVSLCAGWFIRGGRGPEPPDPPEGQCAQ